MGGLISSVGDLFGGAPNNAGFQAQGFDMSAANAAQGQVQQGLGQQQNLINALNAQNGIQNQSNIYNQLQGVANGQGPNPAGAMLNQATGTNVANQAALMAGQRGAGANAGLIARQAGLQGAGIQQNAAGQAATLQAQQSLGALGQMGGLANTQAANQIGAVGNYNQFAQGNQGQILGNIANANAANAGMAGINANNTEKAEGGLFNGIAGATGMKTTMAQGGEVENPKLAHVPSEDRFPGVAEKRAHYPAHLAEIAHYYHGGPAIDFRSGGPVPGQPIVQKDSEKNDTVDAKLSPKEIVLPISVTTAKNAPAAAAKFVAETLAKSGSKIGHEQEFKEALKKAIAGRKKG